MIRTIKNTFWYFVVSLVSIIAFKFADVLEVPPVTILAGMVLLDLVLYLSISQLRQRVRF